MRTAELTGAALDWAVATAAGYPVISPSAPWRNKHGAHGPAQVMVADTKRKTACHYDFRPSECWAQGGPIIEQEGLWTRRARPNLWVCRVELEEYWSEGVEGPSPLIAAMRCYVASKLGDEVEIPEELACGPDPRS